MKSFNLKGLILASSIMIVLNACGGGGGGMTAGGGIDGTGIMSAGVVSAFGSIVVNGTEFDTSEAEVFINGEKVGEGDDAVQDNLAIGMVVTVEGQGMSDGSAIADRVLYSNSIVGPVAAFLTVRDIDTKEYQLEILGQTVVINLITLFKETSFFDIDLEDLVIVSGYRNIDGSIRATFVEKIDDFSVGLPVEVTGFITNLNIGLETFEINNLKVNYSMIAAKLPAGVPADDQFVEVAGTLDRLDGDLDATLIQLADETVGEDIEEIEIMGYVTEIISLNGIIKFKIGNQEVHADADPGIVEYVDGDPADIVLGQKLEAEGSFEGGVLNAWEIEFWKPDQIEIEEIVSEVVSATEFKFEEILIQTDGDTVFEPEELVVDDNLAGREIEVKGVPQNLEQTVIKADKVSFELE